MNKKFIIILSSIVILSSSGCGVLNPSVAPTTTPSVSIAPTTTPAAINKENVATWPRFEFKELGFSVQLPFENNNVKYSLDESDVIDKDGKVVKMHRYIGSLVKEGRSFLGAYSQNYMNEQEPDLIHITNITNESSPRIIFYWTKVDEPGLLIHPLKQINKQGVQIVVFDAKKDFYRRYDGDMDQTIEQSQWAIAFKLPHSDKFKAVLLNFRERDVSLEDIQKMIQTIEFK
jgi:hypothetical protein